MKSYSGHTSKKEKLPNVTNYRSRSSVSCHNRIPDLVLGTNTRQSHQMVLCPGDALRSSGNPRILVLRSSSDSLTEMAVGKDRQSYADIVLAVSTVVFQTTGIGSNPIICSSRPRALTHSPTPGSKKCGVLSKGFLASKSKPDYIPFKWRAVPFKSGEGKYSILDL